VKTLTNPISLSIISIKVQSCLSDHIVVVYSILLSLFTPCRLNIPRPSPNRLYWSQIIVHPPNSNHHAFLSTLYIQTKSKPDTYGHRIKRTRVPVRSLTDKLDIGGLVVGWVTTSESPLLYVFVFCPTFDDQCCKFTTYYGSSLMADCDRRFLAFMKRVLIIL
jgi:hypothetical protein